MRPVIILLALCLSACAAVVEPTPENGCDTSGIAASENEANVLAGFSILKSLSGERSNLASHANNAEQRAEILRIKAELCKEKMSKAQMESL
ncbi:hypothetical protein [Vibrio breoganii]|uniref:hypothetical protein n=1 Tax=Vibrio breoganii TaxID=553239 RepID=UPI000C855C25|nr:hypothetical protein [Vibrio breoganii]PMG86798.1 hypothetical protein BCU81_11370 [Vibrio breoganii]PML35117.1 hypothetical protein BCT78_13015 [Vibrio breoganii]PML92545.1 hypothetical protein BCT64_15805 [Vibrio breoganii]PMN68985.1 hypothetical protein BCT28_03450 [Vibrio breoganii]